MNNIDPYNNAPPPRKGGGGCAGGSCGAKPAMNQQYTGPPMPELQQQQTIPQYTGRTSGRPDLQTENQMLHSDLQVAIGYIRQLGGTWPPPGH